MNLTTPALLFPAITLILLAYTNRFLGLSSVIRHLYDEYRKHADPKIASQIRNLRHRVILIRNMQIAGALSLALCVLSMLLIYFHHSDPAIYAFGASLILMLGSLLLSVIELLISADALHILLADIEEDLAEKKVRH